MNNFVRQSLEDFLNEIAKARKNFGYPVIVAFDRKTANNVLKQEFIERYTGELFLDPMNSEVDIESGVSYHQLSDFCLDQPRLTFENADLSDSKATLMMRTVRGKQLQLSQAVGSTRRQVTRLAKASPINGPSLVFDIELKNTRNAVSENGRVYFSYAAGTNYAFYGGTTQFELDKLGLHFKEYFEAYTVQPGQREIIEYTLGELANLADLILKPKDFKIRTHGAPGTRLRNQASFGDGAVVLFVELEGFDSSNAIPPDRNDKLPYLLPDGYSANVLINSDFITKNLIIKQLKESASGISLLDWAPLLTGGLGYRATGELSIDGFEFYDNAGPNVTTFTKYNATYTCPPEHDTAKNFRITFKNDLMIVDWNDEHRAAGRAYTPRSGLDPIIEDGEFVNSWSIRLEYKFTIETIEGKHSLALEKTKQDYTYNLMATGDLGKHVHYGERVYRLCYERSEPKFKEFLDSIMSGFTTLDVEIDTFILSSLLFRNSQVALDSVHWPNDLLTVGQLAPDRTKFSISTSDNTAIDQGETSVLTGGRIAFTTEPATPGVVWSVQHLPDYTGDDLKGEIDPGTGVYTAPAADTFDDSFIKVIVTAKSGDNVAHALVSVLRTTVSVYPSVMTLNLGAYNDILAGEMNKGAINWAVEGFGKLEDIDNGDPLAQASKRYLAPTVGEVPDWDDSMPLLDMYIRHSRIKVSSGATSKYVDVLLPIAIQDNHWLEATRAGEGVRFEFWWKPKSRPAELVDPENTSWHVRVGSGTCIDGVYTPDPSKAEEYAVIVATNDVTEDYASMILPLPFIDVEQFMALHAPDEAKAV
ncbi:MULTISPECIES: hypothetical protein [Pseudomonas]|jgi:hypothetical protein|uniref:hypothetical protein n=1 Tax=Pseudomonas TaxID=286 RepID=UPI0007612371|nr:MULTISPECIES: hypothetical protein [Pseudomonas]